MLQNGSDNFFRAILRYAWALIASSTGFVSGFIPRQSRNASAACSTNIPQPVAARPAPTVFDQDEEEGLARDVREDTEPDLRVVGREEPEARFGDEGAADLPPQLGADRDRLEQRRSDR